MQISSSRGELWKLAIHWPGPAAVALWLSDRLAPPQRARHSVIAQDRDSLNDRHIPGIMLYSPDPPWTMAVPLPTGRYVADSCLLPIAVAE